MNRILTFTLSVLMLSAPALAQTAPGQRTIYEGKPTGTGEPAAISCYPSAASTSRMRKLDCRPNSEWASMYAAEKHATVDENGKMLAAPTAILH